ncbi:DUF2809 domain-containing protein [Afipia broomeae]|uniref:DUF2809 domain-containing protein n=1 Tax=Afipia broomeae ATCC 49717 TaxID=883078 RepID=K8P8L6_9BRAD|nr:DUF2809 domain-containing protein [Afipia broomeae]EKS37139.1 hypothetical protein HMPREF9695_03557 [Afipia broomeae ATCC 49717]
MLGSRRNRFLIISLLIIGLGLVTRWPALGHHILLKFLGSALWGSLIYCAAVILWPKAGSWKLAIGSAIFSATIEFSQLWHTPSLDRIRDTTLGVLLIGKYFSWWDIMSYFVGIMIAWIVDLTTRQHPSLQPVLRK